MPDNLERRLTLAILGRTAPDAVREVMGIFNWELESLREELAEAYIALSGRADHSSDCATSNAPAMKPGPCDCMEKALQEAGDQYQAFGNIVCKYEIREEDARPLLDYLLKLSEGANG